MTNEEYDNFGFKVTIIYVLILFLIGLIGWAAGGCGLLQPTISTQPTPSNDFMELLSQVNWLMSLAVIALGGGVFVLFMGNQIGIRIIAAALVTIVTLLAITKYAYWFAIAGFVGVVGLVGYTIWASKKEHKTLNTALREIVQGIEKIKTSATVGDKSVINDLLEYMKVIFNDFQSDSTKQIVETIKKNEDKK